LIDIWRSVSAAVRLVVRYPATVSLMLVGASFRGSGREFARM